MAGLLAVLAVLGIILEVPCDATAINATYEQEDIYLDFFMNVFAGQHQDWIILEGYQHMLQHLASR